MAPSLELALGPILFFWPRDTVFGFYAGIAEDTRVDRVYLGEVVCSRRAQIRIQDWLGLARDLKAAGKDVVLSSLALVESEGDLKALRKLVDAAATEGYRVEANDLGAVRLCAGTVPFVCGTHLNIYNADTLAWFASQGAVRWVPPLESSHHAVAAVMASAPDGMETEVFAHGRLGLALSARCFTARHYNLTKDDCQFRCLDHPDGITLDTREGQHFLAMNGIQTLSAQSQCLLDAVGGLAAMGVGALRLSPQSHGMDAIIRAYDAVRRGEPAQPDPAWDANGLVDGYWRGSAGIRSIEDSLP